MESLDGCSSPLDENSYNLTPLLSHTQQEKRSFESDDEDGLPSRKPSFTSRFTTFGTFLLIQIAILVVYAAFTALLFYTQKDHTGGVGSLLPLPAREAIRWETREFPTDIQTNPLAGKPRRELERAWHDLLANDNIVVPLDDMEEMGLSSVHLKDDSGAIASLSVFHALHCLKKVRHMTYKEHYHQAKDDNAMIRERLHADHCIEYIRESLMCHADISLVTYRWINETAQHPDDPTALFPTSFETAEHECVNWPTLDDWATQRRFDLFNKELLQQPEHGLRRGPGS